MEKVQLTEITHEAELDKENNEMKLKEAGILFKEGKKNEAFKLITDLATSGYTKAKTKLGLLYLNGIGVDVDIRKALYWLELADSQNEIEASNHLATIYVRGFGVSKDINKAINYLKKGVAQHDKNSLYALGYLYTQENRIDEAKSFIKQAALLDHPDAKLLYEEIFRNDEDEKSTKADTKSVDFIKENSVNIKPKSIYTEKESTNNANILTRVIGFILFVFASIQLFKLLH